MSEALPRWRRWLLILGIVLVLIGLLWFLATEGRTKGDQWASIVSGLLGLVSIGDRDGDIEWAISQGGLVLLHGPAAAGKSRTAAHTINTLRPGTTSSYPTAAEA